MQFNLDQIADRVASLLKTLWATTRAIGREVTACCQQAVYTLVRTVNLSAMLCGNIWRRVDLRLTTSRLGEAALRQGVGDQAILQELTTLASQRPTGWASLLHRWKIELDRKEWLRQLAQSAKDCTTEAMQSYTDDFRRTQLALDRSNSTIGDATATLLPRTGADRIRAAGGALLAVAVACLLVAFVWTSPRGSEAYNSASKNNPSNQHMTVDDWLKRLSDQKGESKKQAIREIAASDLPASDVVRLLRPLLDDTNPYVVEESLRVLERLGVESVSETTKIGELLANHSDSSVRRIAAQVLGRFGTHATSALPQVRHALNDPEWPVRVQAAESLSQIVPNELPTSEAVLLEVAANDDLACWAYCGANSTLAKISLKHQKSAVESLTLKLTNKSATTLEQLAALGGLANAGSAGLRAAPQVAAKLMAQDELIQHNARKALAAILPSEHDGVDSGDGSITQAIREMGSDSVETRLNASYILLRAGRQASKGRFALRTALLDPNLQVCLISALSLARLGEDGIADLVSELHAADYGQSVLQTEHACVVGLAYAGEPAVKPLCIVLTSRNNHVVALAVSALSAIGKPAVPELISVLQDRDDRACFWAVVTLGLIGPDAVVAAHELERLTNSANPDMRDRARKSLDLVRATPKYVLE